ncbi:ROK family transcriptional regulator [Nocardioides jiangxiensis]|uniref:ROK family protein n=1 Tax=Nocardioides jiangxiensis TaxID=3064524 RepID=A0ABT9AYA8_9ACTN|nr:ROK family protein [Nocardioides sp. WY-20]MDO7867400.1 ROK family protein [Nocardioides sp. WY-20]
MTTSRSPVPAPGSTAALRPANQRRIVELLRARGGEPVTQAEAARETGLAAATVSNIVRDLTAAGILDIEPGSGRRGTVVRFARTAGLVAALDFGHSHLAAAVADLAGVVVAEAEAPLHADHSYVEGLALAGELLDRALAEAGHERSDIRTICVGLPAPIEERVVRASAILPGWIGVDAEAVVGEAFGIPVHVENDANLGAWAEHRVGAARGRDNVVFVKSSSGVGGGLIIDGRLFRGARGMAGEIGHLTIDEQGPLCRCGSRGCLEAYTSTATLAAMFAGQGSGVGMADLVTAAHEGNVSARRVFEDAGLHLGWGLASIVNLVNPDVVVVGGDLALAGDLVLDATRVGLRRHALADAADTPVVVSALGRRASLVGGLLLAAERTDVLA